MGRLFSYNSRLQLTEIQDGAPTTFNSDNTVATIANPLLDLQYSWTGLTHNGTAAQNNGNLTNQQVTTSIPGWHVGQWYAYDTLNRINYTIEHANDPSGSPSSLWWELFNYDQFGNMWLSSPTGDLPSQPLMPSAQTFFNASTNQLNSVSYDAAGNQTVFGSFTLAYDAEGRQISAQQSGSPTATYQYDGLGERVTKSVGGLTTTYVHDVFGNLAAEYNSFGTPPSSPCNTCYLSGDHLGSTRMVTDSYGNPVARHDFYPFGGEVPAGYGRPNPWGSTDSVSTKFTGQERDTETGLDFFQARYHGSAQGRFLSPDPLGIFVADPTNPQSWNQYSYVQNSPLSFVDPSGLCSVKDGDDQATDDPDEPCVAPGDNSTTVTETAPPPVDWSPDINTDDFLPFSFSTDVFSSPITGGNPQAPGNTPSGFRSYLSCIRSGTDYFSLQSLLQRASGGKLGTSWLSGAFLGNSLQSVGDTIAGLANNKPGGALSVGGGEALSWATPPAIRGAANSVPNVSISIGLQVATFTETSTSAVASSFSGMVSASVPALAKAGASLLAAPLEALGTAKLPYDVSVAAFSAVACGIY
jgi:RHS repeat-associated protein